LKITKHTSIDFTRVSLYTVVQGVEDLGSWLSVDSSGTVRLEKGWITSEKALKDPASGNRLKSRRLARINVNELIRILEIPHNKAYKLRAELLEELHANNDQLLENLRRRV